MIVQNWLKNSILVNRAHEFIEKIPGFNVRHCVAVANTISNWNLDETTITAALLHAVIDGKPELLEQVKKSFNEEIWFLIEGVNKLGRIKYWGAEDQVENLRRIILALSQDLRVIFIKLADRLDVMKNLKSLAPKLQKGIALETSEIYAPLAYRLGMQNLSGELQDLAFPIIYPQEHQWLLKNVREHYKKREAYLEKVKPVIKDLLIKNNIEPLDLMFRAKRYASLYKKLLRYDMNIDIIYDLVALRIIVKSVADCYKTLGIIHNTWPPLPGTIRDFIALPKPNGYRSLHTSVFCVDNKITEIQIRTPEMHKEAENGIAASWLYEQQKGSKSYIEGKVAFASTKELAWVEQLRNWQNFSSNSEEFLHSLKIDFFKDRIFVITPKGEVIDLPAGSTPIDFAYAIHSELGHQCAGARVNGNLAALDNELHSGDVVEILTQKGKKPSEAWLSFVKTSFAKNHIKSALKKK
jgi:GTP pyrophosphokinase